jgi:hypothetical protein
MRYLYRILILVCLFFSTGAYALTAFVEPLYWQVSEADDWAYLNNNNSSTQLITYKTISFNYKPGLRLGVSREGAWDTSFYYTNYYTNAKDSATGNVVSSYMGATLAKPSSGYFYNAGQVNFSIHYNIADWDVSKRFKVNEWLGLRPLVGLEGGCINQTINSSFQGTVSTSEDITNKFMGLGPKLGLETQLSFLRRQDYKLSLIALFATSYLMGHWTIKDNVFTTNPTAHNVNVPSRNMGALAFQSKLGANLAYKKFSMSLTYEMNDWINQFQIYDDNTGTHTNDLTLQGLSFKLSYNFY